MRDYEPSQVQNAALAHAQSGGVAREGYGFCADGRSRIDALVPHLQAQGFAVTEPKRHFEVPGAWCISARRSVSAHAYAARASLDSMCRMGDSFRAYLVGGTLTGADGREYALRSIDEAPRTAAGK
ncbi:MAG TPA: hypothetical protein VNH53_11600 [Sphingomicrobium sp.]|jgi:hypothetical protein|nr:hypothetical protein [Sphingomicrobium sp.]